MKPLFYSLVALSSLVLFGCGDDDGPTGNETPAPTGAVNSAVGVVPLLSATQWGVRKKCTRLSSKRTLCQMVI